MLVELILVLKMLSYVESVVLAVQVTVSFIAKNVDV